MHNQMKLLTLLTLLLIYSVCKSQIDIKFTFRDECKGEILETGYELSKLDSGKVYKSANGIVSLPSGGVYFLSAIVDRGAYQGLFGCPIRIEKGNVFNDTISIPKLLPELTALHQRKITNQTCSGVVDGNYSEYYENGRRRLQGTFRDGLADGFLVSYDRNGKKKSKSKYRNGYLVHSRYY